MFGNINQAMRFIQAARNPQGFLQSMGLPQEALSSPDDAARYLMQCGKFNQTQIDQAKMQYQQFMNSNAQR